MNAAFDPIEQLIRQGETNQARSRLEKIKYRTLPRKDLCDFANLCRRANLPRLAARALFPLVRNDNPTEKPASENEKAEYAVSLQRLGAAREALDLLNDLSESAVPSLRLYKAFCYFAQWKYQEARDVLSSSGISNVTDTYQQLVYRVNGLAAQVALGTVDSLDDLFSQLESDLIEQKATRLLANLYELKAQSAIQLQKWPAAETCLEQAAHLFQDTATWDHLYIRKWKTVLAALQEKQKEDLIALRNDTLVAGDFETLRDLDFYLLQSAPTQDLFNYLYFGTPHQSYRQRIRSIAPHLTVAKETSVHAPTLLNEDLPVLDLMANQKSLGSLPHRVTHLLLRDFYHPYRVAEIFGYLHPDEYFNPDTSPNRVYQSLHATRVWWKELGLKLRLAVQQSRFRIDWQTNYRVMARTAILPVTQDQIFQWKLELSNHPGAWSRTEIQTTLGCSKTTTVEFIQRGTRKGYIEPYGAASKTCYEVTPYTRNDAN